MSTLLRVGSKSTRKDHRRDFTLVSGVFCHEKVDTIRAAQSNIEKIDGRQVVYSTGHDLSQIFESVFAPCRQLTDSHNRIQDCYIAHYVYICMCIALYIIYNAKPLCDTYAYIYYMCAHVYTCIYLDEYI